MTHFPKTVWCHWRITLVSKRATCDIYPIPEEAAGADVEQSLLHRIMYNVFCALSTT